NAALGVTIGPHAPAAGSFTTLSATSGSINGVSIGATTPAAGSFTSLSATSGSIDNVSIGATTAATGKFTNLAATNAFGVFGKASTPAAVQAALPGADTSGGSLTTTVCTGVAAAQPASRSGTGPRGSALAATK